MRPSGRTSNQLRPIQITRQFTNHAEGSVLIEMGETRVLCTASVEDGVPRFLKGKKQGWQLRHAGGLLCLSGSVAQYHCPVSSR